MTDLPKIALGAWALGMAQIPVAWAIDESIWEGFT